MHCPGCENDTLRFRDRLRVAARRQAECPACGVAIRYGFWPRVAQSVLGEALLVGAVVGAFSFEAPALIPLAASSWLSLARFLPIQAEHHAPTPL